MDVAIVRIQALFDGARRPFADARVATSYAADFSLFITPISPARM